jgi:hypothetical protein
MGMDPEIRQIRPQDHRFDLSGKTQEKIVIHIQVSPDIQPARNSASAAARPPMPPPTIAMPLSAATPPIHKAMPKHAGIQ